jgi:hypothetical protein
LRLAEAQPKHGLKDATSRTRHGRVRADGSGRALRRDQDQIEFPARALGQIEGVFDFPFDVVVRERQPDVEGLDFGRLAVAGVSGC